MEIFPAQSLPYLLPLFHIGLRLRTDRNPKAAGTTRSRMIHFLHFLYTMKLIKFPGDWRMEGWPAIKRVYTMQAYAIHLATGNNLLCHQLTVGTIKAYCTAAAKLVMTKIHRDPCQWEWQTGNQFANKYNLVLAEQK